MRLTTMALACGVALSGTLTFAREARPKASGPITPKKDLRRLDPSCCARTLAIRTAMQTVRPR